MTTTQQSSMPAPVSSPSTSPGSGKKAPVLPSTLSLGLARTVIEIKQFFRSKDSMIFIFLFPVIFLTVFALVFADSDSLGDGLAGGPISYSHYYLPAMVANGLLLSGFQSLAIWIPAERDEGTLKRLRGTPMPPAAYFLGKIGMVIVSSVLQVALVMLVGRLAFDIALPSRPQAWLTLGWLFLLGTACFTVLGIAFSSVPRSGHSSSATVTPVVLVLQFISGVYFPFSQEPVWLQHVAEVFPLKWVAEGMRSVFFPDSFKAIELSGTWDHPMTALVLGGWLIVGLALGLRTFRWSRRDDG